MLTFKMNALQPSKLEVTLYSLKNILEILHQDLKNNVIVLQLGNYLNLKETLNFVLMMEANAIVLDNFVMVIQAMDGTFHKDQKNKN